MLKNLQIGPRFRLFPPQNRVFQLNFITFFEFLNRSFRDLPLKFAIANDGGPARGGIRFLQ